MAAFFRNERSVSSAAAKPQYEHAKQAVATVISFGGLIYLLLCIGMPCMSYE
jgi:hypothetical protein